MDVNQTNDSKVFTTLRGKFSILRIIIIDFRITVNKTRLNVLLKKKVNYKDDP